MLVGAKDFTVERAATDQEVIEIDADLGCELGPLQLYRVVVVALASSASGAPGTAIASGELKVAALGGGA
jgi:hypothetical protein